MSYHFSDISDKYSLVKPKLEENYKNLNEEKKQQILKELQEEMDKLKIKYMLDEKDKNMQKLSNIKDLDSLTNREKIENADRGDRLLEPEEMVSEDEEAIEDRDYQDQIYQNDEEEEKENSYLNNMHKDNSEIVMPMSNSGSFSNRDLQSSQRSNIQKYIREGNNVSKNSSNNYELFDRAKENLLKVKHELDDMDQYDYRNNKSLFQNYQRNIVENCLDEEEKPKNLEEEISMSMSKSLREDSQHISQNQYKFNAPYVLGVSSNFSPLEVAQMRDCQITNNTSDSKQHMNNYMPRKMNDNINELCNPYNRGRLSNTNDANNFKKKSKSRHKMNNCPTEYNAYSSASGSREKDRKMSPYFKKMIREYNPKYKRNQSKDKFDKLKLEIEDKFEKEHTFKPNVNYANVFSNDSNNYKYNESKVDLYKRLSTPKIVDLTKRLKEKEIDDQRRITEECTFKPNIKVANQPEDLSKEKVENRLYKLAEQMKEKREKLKRDHQENLIKDYSFTPNMDINSKQLMLKYEHQKPIYERSNEIVKNKKQNLQYMRNNIEREEKSFYRPEINPKSKDIIMRKTDRSFNGDFSTHERLYREGVSKNKAKNRNATLDDEQCTFTPHLCYSTTQPGGNIDDFLERQKIYDELKKERLERKLSKSIDNNQYTFKPQINITSDILMKADHGRANEDIKDKVDRLYKDDFEKIRSRKEQLEKFYYAQYDFKPKINEISKYVGKDHTIEELHMKKESSKVRMYRDEANSNVEKCTFKPKINKDKFENIQSNYKPDDNILQRIHSEVRFKNEKVEEIKTLMNEKDMQECKFHPEIRKDVPNYEVKEPIMIKGFAKYIDQMEKARKAKRDKEEREKEVFLNGDNWSRDNLITIPKPFKLSYQTTDKNKQKEIFKKNKEMEMKECTFKPTTNESKNKEIIKMILKN